MNNWLTRWQTAWMPPCLLCGERAAAGRALCLACIDALPFVSPTCVRCAAPGIVGTCGRCQTHPPAFDRAVAAYAYAPPVDRLLVALKFHAQLHVARALGELLADRFASRQTAVDVIVPVPLHLGRLRERGYNQSLELARPLARALNVRLDPSSSVRTRATAPQTALSPNERARNVSKAFAARADMTGLRVAIFDDVMTTGQTLHSLAGCLRRAGAASVEAWVAARA